MVYVGRPPHNPMQHNQFIQYDSQRRRYWARSYVGYMSVWKSKPNYGHYALTYAQHNNMVHRIITQNVDGLHQLSGAQNVVELHGSIHNVVCLACHHKYTRELMQQWLTELNPEFYNLLHGTVNESTNVSGTRDIELAQLALEKVNTRTESQLRPDGDIELGGTDYIYTKFNYPACPQCNGILKADVVFFGGSVPKHVHTQCDDIINHSDGILVIGSSLTVWSAYRLVRQAILRNPILCHRLPSISNDEQQRINKFDLCNVGIINDGPTRADILVDLRVSGRAGQILPWLFDMPNHSTLTQQSQQYINQNTTQEAPL